MTWLNLNLRKNVLFKKIYYVKYTQQPKMKTKSAYYTHISIYIFTEHTQKKYDDKLCKPVKSLFWPKTVIIIKIKSIFMANNLSI